MATPQAAIRKFRLLAGICLLVAGLRAAPAQLVNEQLVTRTFKLTAATNTTLLTEGGGFDFSSPLLPSPKEELRTMLAAAGVDIKDALSVEGRAASKVYFYNERTGALMVRATAADMVKIEAALRTRSALPPQVLIEAHIIETRRADIEFTYTGASTGAVTGIVTDRQYRIAMEALRKAQGVDVITAPPVVTISGRQARLQVEQPPPPLIQTPPPLPKDTRPDADPTPRNQGRLPFPATFTPEAPGRRSP